MIVFDGLGEGRGEVDDDVTLAESEIHVLRRSSDASSCLIRFCTGTLRAASVRGVTVPVAARPWRTWKRFTASATVSS